MEWRGEGDEGKGRGRKGEEKESIEWRKEG